MAKPKTLEQPRAEKGTGRDTACTGTAQAGASGEQKEVSGERRDAQSAPTVFAIWAVRIESLAPEFKDLPHAPK